MSTPSLYTKITVGWKLTNWRGKIPLLFFCAILFTILAYLSFSVMGLKKEINLTYKHYWVAGIFFLSIATPFFFFCHQLSSAFLDFKEVQTEYLKAKAQRDASLQMLQPYIDSGVVVTKNGKVALISVCQENIDRHNRASHEMDRYFDKLANMRRAGLDKP